MKTVFYKNYFLLVFLGILPLIFTNSDAFSQDIIMTDGGNTKACSGTFYDPGGTGNYPTPPMGFIIGVNGNKNYEFTICNKLEGKPLTFTFTEFNLWTNTVKITWPPYNSCLSTTHDVLHLYNGTSTSSPPLGQYIKTNSPGTIVASSGCMTFKLETNNVGNGSPCDANKGASGWRATIYTEPAKIGTIEGPDTLIEATFATYTIVGGDSVAGVWNSGNAEVAFVNTQGKVTALNEGTSNLTYAITECGSDITIKKIVVIPEPKVETPPPPPPTDTIKPIVSINELDKYTNPIIDLTLYPNPTNSIVNIEFQLSSSDEINIQLIDISGRIIENQTVQATQGTNHIPLNVAEYTNGVYSVIVHSNHSKLVKRLVKN